MSLETTTEEKITPEQINILIQKANDVELKYLLILQLQGRRGGCGHLYLYDTEIEIIHGKAELVTLEREYVNECEWKERLLVIPLEISTIVKVSFRDDNPEVSDFDEYYIFTAEGWKSLRVEVPK